MPRLGADVDTVTVVEWAKRPGDAVIRGDVMVVLETPQGAVAIEAVEDGILDRIVMNPGERASPGAVLAYVRADGSPATGSDAVRGVHLSPMARRLAEDLRLDLSTVVGTGPQGTITRDDVQRAAAQSVRTPAARAQRSPASDAESEFGPAQSRELAEPVRHDRPFESPPASPPNRPSGAPQSEQAGSVTSSRPSPAADVVSAAAPASTLVEVPHYYLSTAIDMSEALAWLDAINQRGATSERLLPAALLIKAVALALREVPAMNGYWTEGAFQRANSIHVGCAISLRGGGVAVPVLRETDTMELATLMRRLYDVVGRARSGTLAHAEVVGGTITVASIGDQAVESMFGAVHAPQVAHVGFGRISERPWAHGGRVDARQVVIATVSADSRASDVHQGGVFLTSVDRLLQAPESL
jgi:pyruvate dehydrogenase E2 component (dihydrolipoamide acetyltransferase)